MRSNTKSNPAQEGVLSLASDQPGGGELPRLAPSLYPVAGRSPQLNARIAAHEAGHAYVGRALGTVLHSVSIIPGSGYEGRCRSIGYQSQLYEKPEHETVEIVDLCERAQRLTPELGVNRVESAEFFQRATVLAIELCAGSVAETILHPREEPLPTSHDQAEAAAFASLAVASPRAIPAFLEYCKADAAALILDHLGAAKAIADALVELGELSGAEVDEIITVAIAQEAVDAEKARQAKWRGVKANAGRLAINQTGMRRGASRTERVGEAVAVVRDGANVRQACKIVGLRRGERDVAKRCDQRGVARKHSPARPVFATTMPDPVIVPRK